MNKRPKLCDNHVWDRARDEILKILRRLPCLEEYEGAEECAFDVLKGSRNPDGYNLARKLDENMSLIITAEDVEELNCIDSPLIHALYEMQAEWVKENSITIPFKVGDMVRFNRSVGFVAEVRPHLAQLIIHVDGESGMPIVNVEDVSLIEASVQP